MKTRLAHTPGPWHVEGTGHNLKGCIHGIWIADGDEDESSGIALIPDEWLANRENKKANARLLAAAPELLGALKKFGRHIPACTVDSLDRDCDCGLTAVIAKAEGK